MNTHTSNATHLLVIGTFREGPGLGLSTAQFDSSSGTLSPPVFAAESAWPTFLHAAPDGRHIHVCNEIIPGNLRSYSVDHATGALEQVAILPSGGEWPCFIDLDHSHRFAFVANYHDGAFAVFALDSAGRLSHPTARVLTPGNSRHAQRQKQTHAHAMVADPTNRFTLSVDLGADRVYIHRFDAATGTLTPHEPFFFSAQPGAGPRHLRFHPDHRHAYIVNELDGTVSVCRWNASNGTLRELQRCSSLPANYRGEIASAEIMVHPSGHVVYVSNRGCDTIATFSVDATEGTLTLVEQTPSRGSRPRNFVIDPSGHWMLVANQDGDSIAIFAIDSRTGGLASHGEPVNVKNPACLRFIPPPGSAPRIPSHLAR